ncbi:hypothetical protein HGRIS_010498 [Hohenbuehelia grisea]|uniref:Uncharacterized protein n=1 Tax=Hohenbuehelia grisea TaxID=104357 RepID=A0ABR3IXA5_9AGAR
MNPDGECSSMYFCGGFNLDGPQDHFSGPITNQDAFFSGFPTSPVCHPASQATACLLKDENTASHASPLMPVSFQSAQSCESNYSQYPSDPVFTSAPDPSRFGIPSGIESGDAEQPQPPTVGSKPKQKKKTYDSDRRRGIDRGMQIIRSLYEKWKCKITYHEALESAAAEIQDRRNGLERLQRKHPNFPVHEFFDLSLDGQPWALNRLQKFEMQY